MGNQPSFLQMDQFRINLVVARMPEKANRILETPPQVIAGRRRARQQGEERIGKGRDRLPPFYIKKRIYQKKNIYPVTEYTISVRLCHFPPLPAAICGGDMVVVCWAL
jgi:hypothetical protein